MHKVFQELFLDDIYDIGACVLCVRIIRVYQKICHIIPYHIIQETELRDYTSCTPYILWLKRTNMMEG